MKNFKKVLALVLVLATLLGLATMASATEYKDADKISADYTEAVKVLDLIETMQGYPNGEFKPTANITREEAAKLIAIFDNKDADISTYYTSINPFADEKGRWGESYVGYGYRAGIIAGMNATTFAPTANVTGTQFLKMALVTLGYDQEAEGFVGSSWAVNVLALAKRLDLIDGLADGWKAEKDLTREEAAQILLNTLQADTVEYGQEAKALYNFKKSLTPEEDGEGNVIGFRFNGKLYLTVAGAVKTGKPLYKEFKLDNKVSFDAFERPYTKWVYDKDDDKTVEQMKAPKATFTKTVNGCDILVALGVKETDTKTTKTISSYYVNGEKVELSYPIKLQHTKTPCKAEDKITCGAQGTLTQVFKEEDGTYRITSIDTWLAKVEKVSKTSTARDDHKKGTDAVQLNIFTVANDDGKNTNQSTLENNNEYCDNNAQCDDNFQTNSETGFVTYDDPDGLAKGDYVLVTYSFKVDEDDAQHEKHLGVQSADVVTAKEGNFSGFKYATVSNDPAQTRIDGEYVNDAVHFHFGFDDATDSDNFGTKGFFYDAYGNVIGMKDAADTSKYAVLDRAWVEFNKGTATLHANVVGLDAKVTEDVVVTDFLGIDYENPDWDEKYGASIADLAEHFADYVTYGSAQNYKNFYMVYDYLGKASVNSKNEYSLDRDWSIVEHRDELSIKFVKGEPTLTINKNNEAIKLNSKTQFLVRTGDVGEGKYISWTGYTGSAAKSIEATGYDIVMDDDGKYAEVVYLFNLVAFTDGTVVAYVPKDADTWVEKQDDTTIYCLEAYVNGVYTPMKLAFEEDGDADKINELFDDTEVGRFYKFRYKEVDGINMATLVMDDDDPTEDFNLFKGYGVSDYSEDGILTVTETIGDTNRKTMALAADCVIYSIREDGGKVVKEDKGLEYAEDYIEAGKTVHIDWNDKNDDGVNQIVALYVVEDGD